MSRPLLGLDIPGKWQHWPGLPSGLECDHCDKPFRVGDDVWLVGGNLPMATTVSHLCLDCTERSVYELQRKNPEALSVIAVGLKLVLYRPERDLTLDEIAAIEVATTLLQENGRVIMAHHTTLH